MTKEENKKHCSGCYNDDYNHGLGGAKECFYLNSAELKLRKQVHINQVPPWNQEPKEMLSCYRKYQYVFVDGDRTN